MCKVCIEKYVGVMEIPERLFLSLKGKPGDLRLPCFRFHAIVSRLFIILHSMRANAFRGLQGLGNCESIW